MHVLVLTQHFWPEPIRINAVAADLARAGCTITVLTGKPNYPGGTILPGYTALSVQCERHHGCNIVRVPLVPRGRGGALRLALNYLSFLGSACLIGPMALRRERFDVIFVFGSSPILQAIAALWLKALRGVPVVTWVQDLWPETLVTTGHLTQGWALRGVDAIVSWIYRHSDRVLVQSSAFLGPVSQRAQPTPVHYQPNPSDSPSASDHTPRTGALKLKPGFRIVFAGNLGTVQALDTVVEAARLTTPASGIRWVLVGSGARLEWLREKIRSPDLTHVDVPGRVEVHEMPAIFEQADALLVSLQGGPAMNLTVPSKVQSYLEAGKPILASIDGEGARVVKEACAGLTCPSGDARALAEAALSLQAMTDAQRAELGRCGRAYFDRHFASELVVRQLIGHLQAVVGPRVR